MSDVQAFAYRVPRFRARLPLQFVIDAAVIDGHTLDVSNSGLLVHLSEPVASGTQGRVCLRLDACSIEIAAEVAYTDLLEAGLRFRFSSAAEEAFVKALVKLISKMTARPGIVLREPTR